MTISQNCILFFLGVISVYCAIDIEEGQCLDPHPKAVDFNSTGAPVLIPKTKLYTTLWSRYELYQTVSEISGKDIEDVTEEDIEESCITLEIDEGQPTAFRSQGYHNGTEVTVYYDFVPLEDRESVTWVVRGHKGVGGESWITKGGATYLVYVTCWTTGQKSFVVSSVTKELSPEIKTEVIEHVKSLGFDPKYFQVYSYQNCE